MRLRNQHDKRDMKIAGSPTPSPTPSPILLLSERPSLLFEVWVGSGCRPALVKIVDTTDVVRVLVADAVVVANDDLGESFVVPFPEPPSTLPMNTTSTAAKLINVNKGLDLKKVACTYAAVAAKIS